jgi:hypothetical protein
MVGMTALMHNRLDVDRVTVQSIVKVVREAIKLGTPDVIEVRRPAQRMLLDTGTSASNSATNRSDCHNERAS